jgi:hypothetical protein
MPLSGDTKTATKSLVPSMLMALLGAGLLPAGCAGDGEGAERLGVTQAAYSADPVGSSSTNGLDPNDFRGHMPEIRSAMNKPIAVAPHLLNPDVAILFNGIPFEHNPLSYLLKCGLPGGYAVPLVTPDGPHTYRGLLKTTAGWSNLGGITTDMVAKKDLFACLAAHLNASSVQVDIRLTGAAVRNEAGKAEDSEFTFEEAYWWVDDPGTAGLPQIHVWPLPDLTDACGAGVTSAALQDRICGNDPFSCQLTLRPDLNVCVRNQYGAFCDGHRVLMSWLRTDDVPTMYGCTPPPHGGGSSGGGGGTVGGGTVGGGPTGRP